MPTEEYGGEPQLLLCIAIYMGDKKKAMEAVVKFGADPNEPLTSSTMSVLRQMNMMPSEPPNVQFQTCYSSPGNYDKTVKLIIARERNRQMVQKKLAIKARDQRQRHNKKKKEKKKERNDCIHRTCKKDRRHFQRSN
jgi:hypothetical protein